MLPSCAVTSIPKNSWTSTTNKLLYYNDILNNSKATKKRVPQDLSAKVKLFNKKFTESQAAEKQHEKNAKSC